jgi:hypothetical protein
MHRHAKVALLAGVVGAARMHAVIRNTGGLSGCQGDWHRLHRETGSSGVGGAHSTEETGQRRWREGALVRGALERAEMRRLA